MRPPASIPRELSELPGLLARSATGLQFIYEALSTVAAHYGLRDLVIVVEDATVGRQSFRYGRHPLQGPRSDPERSAWARSVMDRPAGLYADPPVVDSGVAVYISDLTAVALRLDVLHHDATRDALTGLLNRRSYEIVLEQAVSQTERYGWPFGLVMIDLDGFKKINDRLGHAAGDQVLRVLGAEMRACLRSGDVAARLGGDEFALLVANTDSFEDLEPLVNRLKAALHRAFRELPIGFSFGVALFPAESTDIDVLTRLADERLYEAKAAGKAAAARDEQAGDER